MCKVLDRGVTVQAGSLDEDIYQGEARRDSLAK